MKKTKVHVLSALSLAFEENAYIAYLDGSKECVLVDPGINTDILMDRLEEHQLTPVAILVTHGHYDHIGGISEVRKRWENCEIIASEIEAKKLVDPQLNLSSMFNFPAISPKADRLVQDGEEFELAGIRFRAKLVPGHSAGHLVYLILDATPMEVFVGDTILCGVIGRGDFPDGDSALLVDSIKKTILTLPDDTILHSGHGDSSTVLVEKQYNPFLQ